MDMVLTYCYDNGVKKSYGVLEFENGVLCRGDMLRDDDKIVILSVYVNTGNSTYGSTEYYKNTFSNIRYMFLTDVINYDAILKYAKKYNFSLISLLSASTHWYVFDSVEDVVSYLCDNCLVDDCICDVWNDYGIEYLNAQKICESYTVSELSGASFTEFLHDKEDNVWINFVWE